MELREYEVMYETEKDHWWFRGKRKIVFSQVDKLLGGKLIGKKYSILDLGCGTGIMIKEFEKYGATSGIDIVAEALHFCQKRNLKRLVQGDLMKLPFKSNSFDLVSIFDVLYHKEIKNDVNAMKEIYRIMKPGGHLILTDSADMKLWSRHDIAAHARERYTVGKMSSRLRKAGFSVVKASYFNMILYPLVFAYRKLDNVLNKNRPVKTNIDKSNPAVSAVLFSVLWLESVAMRLFSLPFGVSIFVIAKKP
ncbi:MAG: type 11 methyltransferase [archaeon GW2011_AR3]|nr:MAG: type 11 methyltransferase [archaeon GW2011_AR3]MBS3109579.1 class I SAM-dependent methyltransferase [Candidatus Woesearchaeota archaeon]